MDHQNERIAIIADGMNLSISAKNRYGCNLDYLELLEEVGGGRRMATRPTMVTSRLPNMEGFAQCVRRWWDLRVVSPKILPDGSSKDLTDGYIARVLSRTGGGRGGHDRASLRRLRFRTDAPIRQSQGQTDRDRRHRRHHRLRTG